MYIIHKQRQISSLNLIFPYTALFFICGYFLINIIFHSGNIYTKILFSIILLILFVITFSFFYLNFKITNTYIKFGFGIFTRKINKDDIDSIFIENSKNYFASFGIAVTKKKIYGFVAKSGDGLLINTKNNIKYFISLNDPEKAMCILKENNYV